VGEFTSSDVCVIIAVFNNARTVGEAIESVLSQTRPPGEVVVVDDGSTDGSGDVALSFAPAVRVVRQDNQGVAGARNRGVAETTRPLLAAVDADDRWASRKLELQLPLLIDGVDAVSCGVAQVQDSEWREVVVAGRKPSTVLHGNIWESVVIRRLSFQRVGEFDTSYVLAEQVDWWTRAAEAGLTISAVAEPLVFRRLHQDNHGVRRRDERQEYARAIHEALKRRRAAAAEPSTTER
jgi:glycosyltransferase involved in cell wall biosynthesis